MKTLRPLVPAVAMFAVAGCKYFAREATIAYMQVASLGSSKNVEVEIQKSFIDHYRNRVSIDARFTVDESMQNPIAKAFDGDLHLSGRAPEVGLPVVAEIANAA